jgi:hypothetical protein
MSIGKMECVMMVTRIQASPSRLAAELRLLHLQREEVGEVEGEQCHQQEVDIWDTWCLQVM